MSKGLRDCFARALACTHKLESALKSGILVAAEDARRMGRELALLLEAQELALEDLKSRGADVGGVACIADLESLEAQLADRTRRAAGLRASLNAFLALRARDASFEDALSEAQCRVREMDDEHLLKMEETGDIDGYRIFVALVNGDSGVRSTDLMPYVQRFGYELYTAILTGMLEEVDLAGDAAGNGTHVVSVAESSHATREASEEAQDGHASEPCALAADSGSPPGASELAGFAVAVPGVLGEREDVIECKEPRALLDEPPSRTSPAQAEADVAPMELESVPEEDVEEVSPIWFGTCPAAGARKQDPDRGVEGATAGQVGDSATQPAGNAPSSQLAPLHPIQEQRISANAFKNEVRNLSGSRRLILEALATFGAMDANLMARRSNLCRGEDPIDSEAVKAIEDDFKALEAKGLVASYKLGDGPLCHVLTPYAHSSLHKAAIEKSFAQIFHGHNGRTGPGQRPGKHPLVARNPMPAAALEEALDECDRLMSYMEYAAGFARWTQAMQERLASSTAMRHPAIFTTSCLGYPPPSIAGVVVFEADQQIDGPAIYLCDTKPVPPSTDAPRTWFDGTDAYRWFNGSWLSLRFEEDAQGAAPAETEQGSESGLGSGEAVNSSDLKEARAPEAERRAEKPGAPSMRDSDRVTPQPAIGNAASGSSQGFRETVPTIRVDFQQAPEENALALLGQRTPPSSEQLMRLATQLLAQNRLAEAVALLDAAVEDPQVADELRDFREALLMSLHRAPSAAAYSAEAVNRLMSSSVSEVDEVGAVHQALVLASLLWALAFPSRPFDHQLYNLSGMMSADTLNMPHLGEVLALLRTDLRNATMAPDCHGQGFCASLIHGCLSDESRRDQIAKLQRQAKELKRVPIRDYGPGWRKFVDRVFGPSSPVGRAVDAIEANATSQASDSFGAIDEMLGKDWTSDSSLQHYVESCWDDMRSQMSREDRAKLKKGARKMVQLPRETAKNWLRARLDLIAQWRDATADEGPTSARERREREDCSMIRGKLLSILPNLGAVSAEADVCRRAAGSVLQNMARRMTRVLQGESSVDESFFLPLSLTPELMIQPDGTPLFLSDLCSVPGVEPWRCVLRAIRSPKATPDEVLRGVQDHNSVWYRNFGTEALLCEALGKKIPERKLELARAASAAEARGRQMVGDTRLDYAYGKVPEHEVETVDSVLEEAALVFDETHDYGSYAVFMDHLAEHLVRESEERAEQYERIVAELAERHAATPEQYPDPLERAAHDPSEMIEVISEAIRSRNFVTARSYMNMLEAGVLRLPDMDRDLEGKIDFLQQFQSLEDRYQSVCDRGEMRASSPARWGERALTRILPRECRHWSQPNEQKNGVEWLKNWINGVKDSKSGFRIRRLLEGLGFTVSGEPRLERSLMAGVSCEVYSVDVARSPSSLTDYPHPIARFGTQISSPMSVVCLFGCKGPGTVIDVMTSRLQNAGVRLSGSTIVLLDGSLTHGQRNEIADKFKKETSGQIPFLLVDRVLMLYLASLDAGDRQKALLHCTLPYTFEVLYGGGAGAIPEEMFIGRVKEMSKLRMTTGGPSLVYGGRQLGKTALLTRASKTLHDPASRRYSYCVDVKDKGSAMLLESVNRRLSKLLPSRPTSLQELCDMLQDMYDNGTIADMKIFVDEADTLFEEFKESEYGPLHAFVNLRDGTKEHVKFVFAGTHNIAATDSAQSKNNNLLHMGQALCIEPLSTSDAAKLIKVPLSYLGFEIGRKQMELIISSTNSYPGLIHMFCQRLVQVVCQEFDMHWGSAGQDSLPYRISEEQMRHVFSDSDIAAQIGQRVMATIELNASYNAAALVLAYRTYEDESAGVERLFGHTAEEVAQTSRELELPVLRDMSAKNMDVLLDEMRRMGILWRAPDDNRYRFRQRNFLDYIGSEDAVLDKIERLLEADK